MRYLISLAEDDLVVPGALLADRELSREPAHVTIVGAKDDPAAQALYAAARAYPTRYLRIEWLDRREGPLPVADIEYPEMPEAAAFACANGACSVPVFSPGQVVAHRRQGRRPVVRESPVMARPCLWRLSRHLDQGPKGAARRDILATMGHYCRSKFSPLRASRSGRDDGGKSRSEPFHDDPHPARRSPDRQYRRPSPLLRAGPRPHRALPLRGP